MSKRFAGELMGRILQTAAGTRPGFVILVALFMQNQLRFLPSPFNGIGVYANYTFSDSTAHFPNHKGDSTLPGQSRHVGNVAASYEKGGFVGRASVNFHGSYIDSVGADNITDRFYDTNSQFDVSVTQRLTRNVRAYFDALNLNDALLRYEGGPMGIALYRRPGDGAIFAIVSPKAGPKENYLWQYRLQDDGTGRVGATFVRRFGAFSGIGEIEAIAVDDELGYVYYADEGTGIHKYPADPDAPDAGRELALFAIAGFDQDREGISIYRWPTE